MTLEQNPEIPQKTKVLSVGTNALEPSSLAGGLLFLDRYLVLLLSLLLMLPTLIQALASELFYHQTDEPWLLFPILIVERTIQILVSAFVVHRWYSKLIPTRTRARISLNATILRSLMIGFPIWGLSLIPFFSLAQIDDSFFIFVSTVTAIVGMSLALRYFFYFTFAGFSPAPLPEFLIQTRKLTFIDPSLPFKAAFGPLMITITAVVLLSIPYPDGRSLPWQTAASCAEALFWLLSTYTGLAYFLIALPENEWRAAELDPYRKERLETISARGQSKWYHLLSVSGAWKVSVLAMLLFGLNASRQLSLPPAATISVINITTIDKRVQLELQVSDSEFNFRGFRPAGFNLAGETGTPVATKLLSASLYRDKEEILGSLPSSISNAVLYVTFEVDRPATDLVQLQDLWLWYQLKPLKQLTPEILGSKTIVPVDTAVPLELSGA